MSNNIYLISSSISGVPLVLELMENLEISGNTVFNIDILSGRKRFKDGKVVDLYTNFLLNMLYHIPRLRVYVRRCCSKFFIRKNIHENDIIVLHFIDPGYYRFIKQLRNKTKNIVFHWWGSDLYRSDERIKKIQREMSTMARRHVMVNGMNDYFINNFPQEASKIHFAKFGINLLDLMNEIPNDFNKNDLKKKFLIPEDHIVIACGYNGSRGQQHLIMIDALDRLPQSIKSRIFLLLPMTYGADDDYVREIESHLEFSGIKFRILTSFLNTLNLINLRFLSDLTINIQVSDGFSASIRESLYAGNILIVGDWLPYHEIKEWGVFYIETSIDTLKQKIEDVFISYEVYKIRTLKNREIIYQTSSWHSTIAGLLRAYINF